MPIKDPEARRAYHRQWYLEHREDQIARALAWAAAHPDERQAGQRKWYARNGATYRDEHREQLRANQRRWHAAHAGQKSVDNRTQLLRRYGMTRADYDAMLAAQDGRCAICRKVETHKDRRGNVTRLAIDHDHSTGAVRALLCHACNVALGSFGDDPDLIRAAAAYIEERR